MADDKKVDEFYTIAIQVKRITGEKDGRKYDFLAYSGADNRGKKCKFKFTKDASNYPKEEGYFSLSVLKKNINRDKSSMFNEYWIRGECVGFDIYDGFKENVEDLPF